MARRKGLTDAEILEELKNISPSQSEVETDGENEESAESDDDFLGKDLQSSSDSDIVSSTDDECPTASTSHKTSSRSQSRAVPIPVAKGGKRNPVSAAVNDKDNTSGSGPSSEKQKVGQGTAARGRHTRSRNSSTGQEKEQHTGGGDIGLSEEDKINDNSNLDSSEAPKSVPQQRRVGRKSATRPERKVGDVECSPDGTSWTYVEAGNTSGRRSQQNVLKENSGPTGYATRNIEYDSPMSALRLFITKPMLSMIKTCTEVEARSVLGNDDWTISLEELEAFIAVCYARGAFGSRAYDKYDLWNRKWGPPFFTKTMSRNRFSEILRFLRFDIRSTRSQRKVADKFCLASDLWEKFTDSCLACYKPTANMTVDEQLYPTSCRCPFIQYMPSKPDKYGIKYWLLCDAENRYVLNGLPYLGKDDARPANRSLGEHVAMKLAEPYLDKGRNITTDNFFTSTSLGENLKKRNTSLVGTLKRNKREVPLSVRKNDDLYSTALLKSGDNLLTAYQGKTHKNVLVLSTMHAGCDVENETVKKIPETIRYYNNTKAGVDVIDQMSRKYSVRASTRRWPVHVFYNVLDLAMINAHTTFKLVTNQNIKRRAFIFKVCDELAEPYVAIRKTRYLQVHADVGNQDGTRKKCQVLLGCKGNKTIDVCNVCQKRVCGSCQSQKVMCAKCAIEE